MCVLMTFERDVYKNHVADINIQIRADSYANGDGVSLLLVDNDGQVSNYRAMTADHLIVLLDVLPWTRFFLHQRAATTANVGTEFAHGFCSGGVWYMHNGIIRRPEASRLPVDSMIIGRWLSRGTQYTNLAVETFANVFLVAPKSNVFTVHRSSGGSLFTDKQGNFSTKRCAPCVHEVDVGNFSFYLRDPEVVKLEKELKERAIIEARERFARSRRMTGTTTYDPATQRETYTPYDPAKDGVGGLLYPWPRDED